MEKRRFQVDAKLLFDVIQRQAGTLSKAILEGVMNAVDARAKEIRVQVEEKSVLLVDDGHGFKNRNEIENFFETFGKPHEESEGKIFGTFRMGRGQLFAFGANQWRTGPFEMVVDIRNEGLDYQLKEHTKKAPGCRIHIDLYQPLDLVGIRDLETDLTKMVKWLDLPVFFNGKRINKDRSKEKWDEEDDYALYKFRDSGALYIYNLGVLAETIGGHRFGVGGDIVSKKSINLNFARNAVMSDCPVWRKIRATLEKRIQGEVKKKRPPTGHERELYARQIRSGVISGSEAHDLAVFTDVTGRHWTYRKLLSRLHKCRRKITVCRSADVRGDKLMQQEMAFVLSDETLQRFEVSSVRDMVDILSTIFRGFPGIPVEFKGIAGHIKDTYDIIPDGRWTPMERAIIRSIDIAQYRVLPWMTEERGRRRIYLGEAEGALAWTDGETYIAFDRKFLTKTGTSLGGWIDIGSVLVHELCHSGPTDSTHGHGPDFYRMYHDSYRAVSSFAACAFVKFGEKLALEDRRLTKAALTEKARVIQTERTAQTVSGKSIALSR